MSINGRLQRCRNSFLALFCRAPVNEIPPTPPPEGVATAADVTLDAQARACLPALRALCHAFDLAPDAKIALHALSAATHNEVDRDAPAAALRVIARALPEVGLLGHLGRGSAADLVGEVQRSGICVAMAASSAGTILAIVRDSARARWRDARVSVRLLDPNAAGLTEHEHEGDDAPRVDVDTDELARLLAADAPDDGSALEFAWVAASLAMPLGAFGPGGATHGAAADKRRPSPFARLRALSRLERDDLWVVFVYAIVVGVLSLATPIAVQALVNTIAFGSLVFPIIVLTLLLFAVLAFAAVLNALQMRVVETIQQRVFTRVALDLAHRLPRVGAEARDKTYGPELVNRFFDVLTIQKSASVFLLDGLGLVLSAGIGMLVLAFYHPLLLAFDVILVLTVVALVLGLGRRGPSTALAESAAKYRVAGWLQDLMRSGVAFRTRHGAELAAARADELVRAYLEARRAAFVVVFRQYAGSLALQVFATAMLLGLGGWLVVERQLTLGQLVAAELIVAMIVTSLSKLGLKIDAYYDLLAAVDKLGYLVDLPLEREHGGGLLDVRRGPVGLAVRDLRYAYEGGDEVQMPTFSVAPGGRIALVGGAGSGKSTIADVLFGLRAPHAGVVEIDGVDVRELAPHELRAHVALVRAEGVLVIEGTLADNVTLGRAGLGHAEARAALDAVGLGNRVRALPRGIDTSLATTGAPLTRSELRRIGIARAIIGRPRLLVVDGGLAGLDAEARMYVLHALTARDAPWTLVVLASLDDSLVGACDQVLMLDERPSAVAGEYDRPVGEGTS